MRYSKLLDVACGDHIHDWIPYYGLAGDTTAIDLRDDCQGQHDADHFYPMDLNGERFHLFFEDGEFDFVLSDHTIEHLYDPYTFYHTLCRMSSKLVIIKTPVGWMENMFKNLKDGTHKYHFSKTWFIQYRPKGWSIWTRTLPRFNRLTPIDEMEIVLRK